MAVLYCRENTVAIKSLRGHVNPADDSRLYLSKSIVKERKMRRDMNQRRAEAHAEPQDVASNEKKWGNGGKPAVINKATPHGGVTHLVVFVFLLLLAGCGRVVHISAHLTGSDHTHCQVPGQDYSNCVIPPHGFKITPLSCRAYGRQKAFNVQDPFLENQQKDLDQTLQDR